MRDGLTGAGVGAVLFISSNHGRSGSLVRVERVTSTQVIAGKQRYRILDGKRVGDSGWSTPYARIATPEDIDIVRRERALCTIQTIKAATVAHVTTERLSAIAHELTQQEKTDV